MVIPTLGGLNMSSYKKIEEKFSLGDRILPTDIPDIDLYMDQVIQLFDSKYQPSLRKEEDKVLTKTMINNYAKGKLLFPIKNKKYSKEHIMLISLIYQLKGSLSINDIKSVLEPLKEENIRLEDFYSKVMEEQEGHAQLVLSSIDSLEKKIEATEVDDLHHQLLLIVALSNISTLYRRAVEYLVDDLTAKKEKKE